MAYLCVALIVPLLCGAEEVLAARGFTKDRQLCELRSVSELGKIGTYDQDEGCDHCRLHWMS